jgi:choline dehydrogenase-like flavoprotein
MFRSGLSFGRALAVISIGLRQRLKPDLPLAEPSTADNQLDTELRWGSHHMGTTRMHVDPRLGVVDPEARVHSVTNLYVAGSSSFPNVGVGNPTLTIIALALKLASHLQGTPVLQLRKIEDRVHGARFTGCTGGA